MLRHQPIKRKLMTVFLLTSGAVLLLTCGAFLTYELVTFRQTMVRSSSTLAQVIALNSTAALLFDDSKSATEVLAAFAAEPHIVAAGLYDKAGTLFAKYPADGRYNLTLVATGINSSARIWSCTNRWFRTGESALSI